MRSFVEKTTLKLYLYMFRHKKKSQKIVC